MCVCVCVCVGEKCLDFAFLTSSSVMLQKNCCFWYQRAGCAKQGAHDLHLLRGEGESSSLRGVRSPGKLSSDPKVKIRSQ